MIVTLQGAFPLPCGAESTSSVLNEEHLLARLPVASTQVSPIHQHTAANPMYIDLYIGMLIREPC